MDYREKKENATANVEVDTVACSSKSSDKNHMKINRKEILEKFGTEKIVLEYGS